MSKNTTQKLLLIALSCIATLLINSKANAQAQTTMTPELASKYFQHDADLARLEHLEYWTGLIEDYKTKIGHYPLQNKLDGDRMGMVRIATSFQQTFFDEQSPSYRKDLDYNSTDKNTGNKRFQEFTVNELIETLENGLGHKITPFFDIQKAPTRSPVWYNYYPTEHGYAFYITCITCGVTKISTLLFDGFTPTVNIASPEMKDKVTKALTRQEMLSHPTYIEWKKRDFIKEGFVRHVEKQNASGLKNKTSNADDLNSANNKTNKLPLINSLTLTPWSEVLEARTQEHKKIVTILENMEGSLEDTYSPEKDFYNQIHEIIFLWTGVNKIDPQSRGNHIDGRKLAALEKVMKKGFEQTSNNNSPNPNYEAAQYLLEAYKTMSDRIYANLVFQITDGTLYTGTTRYDHQSDTYINIKSIDAMKLHKIVIMASTFKDIEKRRKVFESLLRSIEYGPGLERLDKKSSSYLNAAIKAALPDETLKSILENVRAIKN